jgi:hypothetical protein
VTAYTDLTERAMDKRNVCSISSNHLTKLLYLVSYSYLPLPIELEVFCLFQANIFLVCIGIIIYLLNRNELHMEKL